MTSSSFESSKLTPCEITPLGGVSFGGPVSQAKKKSSRSFLQVVVPFVLVCLGFTVYSRLSSLASSSSVVDQSVSKSVNNVNKNDSIVIPTASLVASETKTNIQQVTKDTTTTELSVEKPAKHVLQFPEGVYDESMNGDTRKLLDITNKCNEAADSSSDAEVLACQIYTSYKTPIVFGTLKNGANLLELATDMETISSSDVSSLFVDYAFAAMIDRGCFVWNSQSSPVSYTRTEYTGKESYKNEYSKQTGVSVDSSVSAFGITVEAGYEQSNSQSSGSEGTTETAYGQRKNSAEVGTLTNVCFDSQNKFDKIRDLVKPDRVQCWTAIRQYGRSGNTVPRLLGTGCFPRLADGGLLMPLKYIYRVGTKSTLSTSYTTSSTTATTGAKRAITAGLAATHNGVSGSVSTSVTSAVDQSKRASGFSGTVKQRIVGFGSNVGITCFAKNNCPQVIERAVKSIREDYTLLGLPSSLGHEYISLDNILKFYFKTPDFGLPDAFKMAYSEYEFKRCPGCFNNQRKCEIRHPRKNVVATFLNNGESCNKNLNGGRSPSEWNTLSNNDGYGKPSDRACCEKKPSVFREQRTCIANYPGRNVMSLYRTMRSGRQVCNDYYSSTSFTDHESSRTMCCVGNSW